ncbi:DNA/RNA non-specific endonuclease [Okeania sp.]|uniref:DNA/RNA non-specific endonuclease n=1 Tax=Okeania sp. TaxID=3100323 RepID=UPI002B4ACE5E|nr:DNA/RNA non-specific endonuclease [Okeania sp.]MEB3341221.1 DNA/RNA non-specific endonuclease [Okeania sp.]
MNISEKRNLLTRPWNGIGDFNPKRILTATWKLDTVTDTGKWYGHDGQTEISLPTSGLPNTNSSLTLPEELTLTAGQTYHWAVEVIDRNGNSELESRSFQTENSEHNLDNTFSSVSVVTHGFKLPTESPGIPDNIYNLGNNIAESGGEGLMMRYNRQTGGWDAIDKEGRLLSDVKISDYYGKPLVLLTDWSSDNQSSIPDSGFSEGAADAFFASLVQLDQQLGGTVANIEGKLVNKHGAVFDSPLHFIGFSRGAVVNSEMIQRIGTHFPHAGGPLNADGTPQVDSEGSEIRDLQMTTIDPHDFEQPGFSFPEWIPFIGGEGFGDFNDPEVQVWENVTFADNYYQTVPKLDPNFLELTATPAGRLIENADLNIFLGTNSAEENYENSRAGFTRETDGNFWPIAPSFPWEFDKKLPLAGRGAVHGRVLSWYDGTTNLSVTKSPDELYRRLGDGHHNHLYDSDFSGVANPWYTPDHNKATFELGDKNAPWEGIGTGWFYSVLGGGKDLRPESKLSERVSMSFDNTSDRESQGDFAVPTLFNGNFDAVFNPNGLLRNSLSDGIPGWSGSSPSNSSSSDSGSSANVNSLVEWSNIGLPLRYRQGAGYDGTTANYALKLDSNFPKITHNPFVIPEWGNLRFDVYAPKESGKLKVQLEVEGANIPVKTIDLAIDAGTVQIGDKQKVDKIKEIYGDNVNSIGYRRKGGFETFQFPFQKLSSDEWKKFMGKPAKLTFTLEGDSEVFIDNVFFKSAHIKLGNPTNARWDATQETPTNLLVEKPGYTVSYNTQTKTPNWVSWQVNKTWTVPKKARLGIEFIDDPFFSLQSSHPNWPKVNGTIFTGLGMDRGHLIPDRDRNRNPKDTIETYMGSNLIAQSMDNNRRFTDIPLTGSAWFNIEKMIGNDVEAGKEYYVVAGSLGNDWSSQKKSNAPELLEKLINQGDTNPQKFNNNISIPEWTWKNAIALPKPGMEVTSEAEAFVYITPNHAEPTDNELPIEHPLNQLLGEERDPIESRDQWRNPETWRIGLQQLQDLLNSRKDPQNPEETDPRFNFQFDFLSHITDQEVRGKLMKDGEYVPF